MNKKLTDSDLLAVLNDQVSHATGGDTSNLNNAKATALDYYYGDQSLIDADEGESHIITREVLENVERELGQQLKVFASGERTVQFDPVGQEDEEQADQETDYINHIYNKENDGFIITHNWIKSALLEKNSYVKVWIEEEESIETQTYTGLSDMGLAEVLSQEGVEPLEHSEETIYNDDVLVTSHDIKVKVTSRKKQIKVAAVPGEEIGVARNHNALSLKDCSFVYHRPPRVTASDLIQMGFDEDIIDTLPGYNETQNELQNARNNNATEDSTLYSEADWATREIEVYECYLRIDYDNDGVAELRKITKAGDTILDNEEIDFIPFATLCPLPMPNKHEGLSYADMLMDIQDVKTVLVQQILTNLYFTNLPELEAVEGQVNLDDLLSRKSGSVKRVKTPGSINPISIPFTAGASLPMLEVLDSMAAARVGDTQALDPNVLAKATAGAFLLGSEQANQLSEKLARTFAETGFKELFLMIHELAIKHYDKQTVVKLRNKYTEVKPTEWKNRTNMSVVVGLGTGNRDTEINRLYALAEKQEYHMMNGSTLVDEKNLYNTYARLIERSGLKDPNIYFTDPESPEAQQKQQQRAQQSDPSAEMQKELLRIEAERNQLQMQRQQMDYEQKMANLMAKLRESDDKNNQFLLKLSQQQQEHEDKLDQKYIDMEIKYNKDIAGQGQ